MICVERQKILIQARFSEEREQRECEQDGFLNKGSEHEDGVVNSLLVQ
jgi:hypothetical protein